jgi:hypothetical protein
MNDKGTLTNKERFAHLEKQLEQTMHQVSVLTAFAREVSPVIDALQEKVRELEGEQTRSGLVLPPRRI